MRSLWNLECCRYQWVFGTNHIWPILLNPRWHLSPKGHITVTNKFFYGELQVWMQIIGSLENYPRIALDRSNYFVHIS